MHVITRKRLLDFAAYHADATAPLDAWYRIVKAKTYADSHQLKQDFPQASFLGGGCTVFNIGGNKYRLVAVIDYDRRRVYIRRVLTHEEYDEMTAAGTLCD